MVKIMKKTVLLAGLLFALPLLAQNPPANPPPDNPPPAQKQPSLEAPQMAAPEPEQPKKPATPPAKSAKPTKPALMGEGKVVEEIIARDNLLEHFAFAHQGWLRGLEIGRAHV